MTAQEAHETTPAALADRVRAVLGDGPATSPSTSTRSTPPSPRGPARRRSAASPPGRRRGCCGGWAGSPGPGWTWSRSPRPMTMPRSPRWPARPWPGNTWRCWQGLSAPPASFRQSAPSGGHARGSPSPTKKHGNSGREALFLRPRRSSGAALTPSHVPRAPIRSVPGHSNDGTRPFRPCRRLRGPGPQGIVYVARTLRGHAHLRAAPRRRPVRTASSEGRPGRARRPIHAMPIRRAPARGVMP